MVFFSSPAKSIRARILVSGSVQDVGYRFRTARQARKHGILGFVRNLEDGNVEIFCQADSKEQFEVFLKEISQNDFLIIVEDVKVYFPKDKEYIEYPLKEKVFYIEY